MEKKTKNRIIVEYEKCWIELHALCTADGLGAECTRESIKCGIERLIDLNIPHVPRGRIGGADLENIVATELSKYVSRDLAKFFLNEGGDVKGAILRFYNAYRALRNRKVGAQNFEKIGRVKYENELLRAQVLTERYRKIAESSAEKIKKIEEEIERAGLDSNQLSELIEHLKSERKLLSNGIVKLEQELKLRQSSKGGRAKADKLEPVKEYCRKLYSEMSPGMRHQTRLKYIREKVIDFGREKGHELSFDQFIKTATGWVADIRPDTK